MKVLPQIRGQCRGRWRAGVLRFLLVVSSVGACCLKPVWCKSFSVLSYRWDRLCRALGPSRGRLLLAPDFAQTEMEEICSSLFGPGAISAHKVRSAFINGPAERSAVLTVAALLARNVYHIGGTVAVPQKCRITQPGKFTCPDVFEFQRCRSMCLSRNPINTNKHKWESYLPPHFPAFTHRLTKKTPTDLIFVVVLDRPGARWQTDCILNILLAGAIHSTGKEQELMFMYQNIPQADRIAHFLLP